MWETEAQRLRGAQPDGGQRGPRHCSCLAVTQLSPASLRGLPVGSPENRAQERGGPPEPHVAGASHPQGSQAWGIRSLLSYFRVFSSRRFREHGLIGKHHSLHPLLQELGSPRQITPLISAWRAGRGRPGVEPRSDDKGFEAPASAAVSKRSPRGTHGVCKGNLTTWSPQQRRGRGDTLPWTVWPASVVSMAN